MIEYALYFAYGCFGLALLFCLYRVVFAPGLADRVLAQEHRIYPLAVRWFAEGRLQLCAGRVVLNAAQDGEGALVSPCPPS